MAEDTLKTLIGAMTETPQPHFLAHSSLLNNARTCVAGLTEPLTTHHRDARGQGGMCQSWTHSQRTSASLPTDTQPTPLAARGVID